MGQKRWGQKLLNIVCVKILPVGMRGASVGRNPPGLKQIHYSFVPNQNDQTIIRYSQSQSPQNEPEHYQNQSEPAK